MVVGAPELPRDFALRVAPNPFNPATTIKFSLPKEDRVTIRVMNMLGQEIARLVDDPAYPAGFHTTVWDGRNKDGAMVASGVYLVQARLGNSVKTRKMVFVE